MQSYRILFSILILVGLVLVACIPIQGPQVTVPPPSPWVPTVTTAALVPTHTATHVPTHTPPPMPTSTPVPTHTPSPVSTSPPTQTPLPPTPAPPGDAYAIEQEQQIGAYTVRLWRNTSDQSFGFDNIATISHAGQEVARVEQVLALGTESGSDLTGEGDPEAVIRVYTGGAHCCFSTITYNLGETPRKVLETPQSNCDGSFKDLDGDGVYEYVTCDDLFAYAYCPYAGSPVVRVVLQYDPERGYVPASPRFADAYAEAMARHRTLAESARPGKMGEWDGTNKCGVLPLILDYLYTDRPQEAWTALGQFYDQPDVHLFWAEVVQATAQSPLYAPGTSRVEVPAPLYYMLQLLTSCGAEWRYIGLLDRGQSPCDQAVPYRDVFWVERQLRQVGLLAEGERIDLGPESCTTNCRLDVIRTPDGARRGSIRLDTTTGFPGEVYRVNGTESEHWQLRGDLTWERVPR